DLVTGHVGKGAVLAMNVQTCLTGVTVSAVFMALSFISTGGWKIFWLVLFAVTLISTIAECLFYNVRKARAFRCSLSQSEFTVTQGVLFQKFTSIPRHQILYTRIRRGPLARKLGLSTFVVG